MLLCWAKLTDIQTIQGITQLYTLFKTQYTSTYIRVYRNKQNDVNWRCQTFYAIFLCSFFFLHFLIELNLFSAELNHLNRREKWWKKYINCLSCKPLCYNLKQKKKMKRRSPSLSSTTSLRTFYNLIFFSFTFKWMGITGCASQFYHITVFGNWIQFVLISSQFPSI